VRSPPGTGATGEEGETGASKVAESAIVGFFPFVVLHVLRRYSDVGSPCKTSCSGVITV
jgi:hypothetical protein